MSNIAQEQASALVQHFAEAASFVLSQIAGTTLHAQPVTAENPAEAATLMRVEITGSLLGICELALSAAMTAQFAALLTGEPPAADIDGNTREAAAELIQQICGNAADRLRRAFGPLELKPNPATERDADIGARHLLLISRENNPLEFELHIVRLAAAHKVETAPKAASQVAAQPVAQPSLQSSAASAPEIPGSSSGSRNLDLLLDIELGASLRFGTRQMLLKDIIELCSGSVVELDRRVQSPSIF